LEVDSRSGIPGDFLPNINQVPTKPHPAFNHDQGDDWGESGSDDKRKKRWLPSFPSSRSPPPTELT
jgi:hypothetical protein